MRPDPTIELPVPEYEVDPPVRLHSVPGARPPSLKVAVKVALTGEKTRKMLTVPPETNPDDGLTVYPSGACTAKSPAR